MGIDQAIPKGAKLTGLHIFCKNDVPEGFGVGLDEAFFDDHPEAQDNFVTASQMSIDFYRTLETDEGRQELIADIQSQFAQVCQWFVQHKAQSSVSCVKPMNEDWIAYFVLLLDDISFLTEVGLLPNNEYNGVQWMWFDSK